MYKRVVLVVIVVVVRNFAECAAKFSIFDDSSYCDTAGPVEPYSVLIRGVGDELGSNDVMVDLAGEIK